jgi:hypothetical protein
VTVSSAAPPASSEATGGDWYAELGAAYQRVLAERHAAPVVLAKKWQPADLVWPHSDIDLRVVVTDPPADWLSFNDTMATVHRELVAADATHRRLLEHPTGWVYLQAEVDQQLVPPAELVTWSACHPGDQAALAAWTEHAELTPWSAADERFYHGILASRVDGAYRLELDSADNVVLDRAAYPAHCVVWHYLAPVVFAAASLRSRHRYRGKTDALHAYDEPEVRRFLTLARDGYRQAPTPEVLLDRIHQITATLSLPARRPVAGSPPTRAEVVSAIGVLRCRAARYAYYLDPPAGAVTGYLIDRETKDFHGAVRILHTGLDILPAAVQVLAQRFLALVPPPPTTRDSLQRFLDDLARHAGLVNDFFSSDLTTQLRRPNGNGQPA